MAAPTPPVVETSQPNIDAISAAALGSLLSYVKEFGTPFQSARAGRIFDLIEEQQERLQEDSIRVQRRTSTRRSMRQGGGENDDAEEEIVRELVKGPGGNGSDWLALRQLLYEISGDWLWSQACSHFRTQVAPLILEFPDSLKKEVLRVKKPIQYRDALILNNRKAKECGYFPFDECIHVFPGSEDYYESAS